MMNIELMETILGICIVLIIIATLFAEKLIPLFNFLWSAPIRHLAYAVALFSGGLSILFIIMGYSAPGISEFDEILISLRMVYVLSILLSCGIVCFFWRMKRLGSNYVTTSTNHRKSYDS